MSEWWGRLGTPLPRAFLPRTGFSVKDESLLCGCFLYVMECQGGPAGWISHTIANPDRRVAGYRGLDFMMEKIGQYSKEHGFIAMAAMTSSRLLSSLYERHGFLKGDSGIDMYFLTNGKRNT